MGKPVGGAATCVAVVRSLALTGAPETFARIVQLISDITTANPAALDASTDLPA